VPCWGNWTVIMLLPLYCQTFACSSHLVMFSLSFVPLCSSQCHNHPTQDMVTYLYVLFLLLISVCFQLRQWAWIYFVNVSFVYMTYFIQMFEMPHLFLRDIPVGFLIGYCVCVGVFVQDINIYLSRCSVQSVQSGNICHRFVSIIYLLIQYNLICCKLDTLM